MKILTILGTRPEIIRLSILVEKLDRSCDHVLVHTGQNHDPSLSGVFFEELGVRAPDHQLDVRADGFGRQIGNILAETERLLKSHQRKARHRSTLPVQCAFDVFCVRPVSHRNTVLCLCKSYTTGRRVL